MPAKRSIFNKPKWAAQKTSAVDDSKPLFHQDVYEDIIHAQRKRDEERLARQKQKVEKQKRTSESRDTQVDENDKSLKKRRISNEPARPTVVDDDSDADAPSSYESDSAKSNKGAQIGSRKDSSPYQSLDHQPVQSTPEEDRRLSAGTDTEEPRITVTEAPAEGSDDDFAIIDVQTKPKSKSSSRKPKPPPPPAEPDTDEDEDDYIRELKRQAREQAKPTSPKHRNHKSIDAVDGDNSTPTPPELAKDDPHVHIRITTMIPGCHELFIRRLASQSLETVLKYFLSQFQLQPNVASSIFFTWNHQKLYPSTTMRSILLQIKTKHGTKPDGSDLSEGRIEIEAVTEQIYQFRLDQQRRERERKEREQAGEDVHPPDPSEQSDRAFLEQSAATQPSTSADAASGFPQDSATAGDAKGKGTVIHLKPSPSSNLPELALRVHANTLISRIIRGYKRKMNLPAELHLYLLFDGDVLDTEARVDEFEFEDGDAVDVGVRDPGT